MKKTGNLMHAYRALLTGKEWYHQRFDGSPMFIFAIAEAEMKKESRKPKGTGAHLRACFFEDGKVDWYLEMGAMRRAAKRFVALAKKNPRLSTQLLKKWKKDEQVYERYFWKTFPAIDLKKCSDAQLLEVWNTTYALFINCATSTILIDHFALGTDEIISALLRKELFGSKNSAGFKESQFTEIFSIATAPACQSFINQAEIELLKIITGISKDNLDAYQKRWYWSKNNYITAQVLSVKHFQEEIKAWEKSGKDLKKELKNLHETPRLNRVKKQALLKKVKLSALLRALIRISEDFTWWQDKRKKFTYFNIDMGCTILREVARRTGYTLDELKFAYPGEIKNVVSAKTPSRKELKERKKSGLVVVGEAFDAVPSVRMNELKKMILGEKPHDQVDDFRGLSASTGRAIGTVRILNSATETDKVKQGDILVAVMTRPDCIAAMKKAAAIVTNEGGITSHAAIVARELGIPCIIGTKIATEVLRDGDLVEVNANHGWVKKLK